jgi:hypothetical protein
MVASVRAKKDWRGRDYTDYEISMVEPKASINLTCLAIVRSLINVYLFMGILPPSQPEALTALRLVQYCTGNS